MKLKRCFIDEYGNIWRDATLIKAALDIQARPFDVAQISFDEVLRWKIVNVRDYVAHYKRVRDADCSIPIILRDDGYPMDGWHRITGENIRFSGDYEVLGRARSFLRGGPNEISCISIAD